MRGPADQAGDPGLDDGGRADAARLAVAAVHGVDRQEAPFEPENGSIALVEARSFGGDGLAQDLSDGGMEAIDVAAAKG